MKKAIVCGTRFGQFYIEAFKHLNNIELVGILANGSKRSLTCAKKYGLTLYRSVNEIPSDIDFACIAIKSEVQGGEGNKIAKELMRRGVNIIFEQPIHMREFAELSSISEHFDVCFSVGNLYMNLPAVKNFINNAKIINNSQVPLYMNVDFATQLSYPVAQIIDSILPTTRNWKIHNNVIESLPFHLLAVNIDGVETTFRAQNEINKDDVDGNMHILFSIIVGYPGGRLILTDPHGPVIWQPKICFPKEDLIPAGFKTNPPCGIKESNYKELYNDVNITQKDIFTSLWIESISKDIKLFSKNIDECKSVEYQIQKQKILRASINWRNIMQYLGYPQITTKETYRHFSVKDLIVNKNDGRDMFIILNQLNRACIMTMLYLLMEKLPIDKKQTYTLDEILSNIEYKKEYKNILLRWIKVLLEEGYINKNNGAYIFEIKAVNFENLKSIWRNLECGWKSSVVPEKVLKYFKSNAFQLKSILRGEKEANVLLFEEGHDSIAVTLYSETPIARYLNSEISERVSQFKFSKDTTILEIGAGTGSTTRQILDKIGEKEFKEYIYSDISEYFLNNAKESFKAFKKIRYEIVDINQEGDFEDEIDIVIAVGVINNARNIKSSLEAIKRKLKKGGKIFIVEAIGESMPMLISQVFMMEEANDVRKKENLTFLHLKHWYHIFNELDLKILEKIPHKDNELSAYNQVLFILER